ncbi:MAG TPA: hypothetical protein VK602_00760 [Phyllobacterium sp.]|nr:hypothetical protein [Phyllobacterium sp.]
MTTVFICFGIGLVLQFVWHLARAVEKRSQERSWRQADTAARDIMSRQLIGHIHALEQKRDRQRIGTREYESLDLEAYESRRQLVELIKENSQAHAD